MDGKEAIIAKIREEAENNAARIISEAKNAHAQALAQAQAQADLVSERKKVAARAECEAVVLRAVTLARLECRKSTLEKKQAVLKEAYSLAREKLLSDEKAYREFYADIIKTNAEDGDAVSVGDGDEKVLDAKWLKSAAPTLELSKEKHSGRGVILVGKSASKVFTLDVIFALLREKTESRVAEILFGDN